MQSTRDRPDEIEVTTAMIEGGVDLAVDFGVENVSLPDLNT
jgi:hypothetical protein